MKVIKKIMCFLKNNGFMSHLFKKRDRSCYTVMFFSDKLKHKFIYCIQFDKSYWDIGVLYRNEKNLSIGFFDRQIYCEKCEDILCDCLKKIYADLSYEAGKDYYDYDMKEENEFLNPMEVINLYAKSHDLVKIHII